MLLGIHHIGVVVDDMAEAERFLHDVLGLSRSRSVDVDGRPDRANFYRCGNTDIEVIEVINPEHRASRLGEAKAQIEHIAFRVESLERAAETLRGLGVETTTPLTLGSTLNAWSDPSTSDGVMYQFVEQLPDADGEG